MWKSDSGCNSKWAFGGLTEVSCWVEAKTRWTTHQQSASACLQGNNNQSLRLLRNPARKRWTIGQHGWTYIGRLIEGCAKKYRLQLLWVSSKLPNTFDGKQVSDHWPVRSALCIQCTQCNALTCLSISLITCGTKNSQYPQDVSWFHTFKILI